MTLDYSAMKIAYFFARVIECLHHVIDSTTRNVPDAGQITVAATERVNCPQIDFHCKHKHVMRRVHVHVCSM